MIVLSRKQKRYSFLSELENTIYKYSLLYIDIIKFRSINNTYGSKEGDFLLKEVIKNLDKVLHELKIDGDICVYEKDTILVKINNYNEVDLSDLIDRIIMHEYKYKINFRIAFIEVNNYKDAIKFIENVGKVSRNRIYEVTEKKYDIEKLNIKHNIERYLKLKEDILINKTTCFSLVYQPKIDLKRKDIISWEILSRWNHPEYGIISPSEFIKIIEDLDKEYEFDISVFERMCRDISKIKMDNNKYSINVSVNTLKNTSIYNEIMDITSKYCINPNNITFEIVEKNPIDDYDKMVDIINNLDKMGYKISIDDFGTGYSSYYRLCNINFSEVKIPREFLKSDEYNKEKQVKVLEGIVSMCKSLGCKTVIEGIETIEDHNLAHNLGVDYGQGYLYSRPVPFNKYLEMIGNN